MAYVGFILNGILGYKVGNGLPKRAKNKNGWPPIERDQPLY